MLFRIQLYPKQCKRLTHAVIAAEATLHATSRVTDGDYDTATDTLIKASHGLVVGDVISVISATATSGLQSSWKIQSFNCNRFGNVVLTDIDGNALHLLRLRC